MKKIIVTGGSGFIGTNLMYELINAGHTVLNIDKKDPREKKHTPYFKKVDILNLELLSKTIQDFEPEIVIHLAALTDIIGKDLNYYRSNIEGTENMVKALSNIPTLKRVVYTSSMYVSEPGIVPKDYDTYAPHTAYGESKVKNELLVKSLKNLSYDWVIIRPSSIWGPWFETPYITFFKTVYEKKYFSFGKACTKTYGYVGNTVYQIMKIMEANIDEVKNKTFYLGDLPATNISEWANEISIGMNKGLIRKVPYLFLKFIALFGDMLKLINVQFPLNSFRLNNMATNNILPVEDIYKIAGEPPYTRKEGLVKTLAYMQSELNYKF
jgi:nucleoside-diphosphate-sugar epimerase